MTSKSGAAAVLGALILGGAALAACGSSPSHAQTTAAIKADKSNGLVRKSIAPAFIAFTVEAMSH